MFSLLSQHVHSVSIKIWTRQAAVPLGKESRRYMYYDYWNDQKKKCKKSITVWLWLQIGEQLAQSTENSMVCRQCFYTNNLGQKCQNVALSQNKVLESTSDYIPKEDKGAYLLLWLQIFPPSHPPKNNVKIRWIVIVPDWTTLIRLGSGN